MTFTPQPAFRFDSFSGTNVIRGRVTSIAEKIFRRLEVWFSVDGGTRTKVYASAVYLDNLENGEILAEVQRLQAIRKDLDRQIDEARAKLTTILQLVGDKEDE